MIEVELKARLADREAAEKRVASFAKYLRGFVKADEYWHGPDWRFVRGTKGFRLRQDDGKILVNFKHRRNEGGIEINKETEFAVSDAAAFVAFVSRIGCERFYNKRKSGRAYEYDGATIELVTVEGLGDFIEIEKLAKTDNPEEIAVARGIIRKILDMSGVADTEIEGRSYSELMIAGQKPY
ncbi:class IV adenylate cyclase [Spirochaetota bacterium]